MKRVAIMNHNSEPKVPFWKTAGFWGGVVPMLPILAISVGTIIGLEKSTLFWVVSVAAVPIGLLFAAAIAVLTFGVIRELAPELLSGKPWIWGILSLLVAGAMLASVDNRVSDCSVSISVAGQAGCE